MTCARATPRLILQDIVQRRTRCVQSGSQPEDNSGQHGDAAKKEKDREVHCRVTEIRHGL